MSGPRQPRGMGGGEWFPASGRHKEVRRVQSVLPGTCTELAAESPRGQGGVKSGFLTMCTPSSPPTGWLLTRPSEIKVSYSIICNSKMTREEPARGPHSGHRLAEKDVAVG